MNKFMIIIPIFFIILVVWFCNPTTQNGFLCVVMDHLIVTICLILDPLLIIYFLVRTRSLLQAIPGVRKNVFDFARFKFCCFSLYLANLNLLNMFPEVQNALYDLPETGRHKQKWISILLMIWAFTHCLIYLNMSWFTFLPSFSQRRLNPQGRRDIFR
jgi:hypothetical protein